MTTTERKREFYQAMHKAYDEKRAAEAHEHTCLYDEDGVQHDQCRCGCGATRNARGGYHGTIEIGRLPWESPR